MKLTFLTNKAAITVMSGAAILGVAAAGLFWGSAAPAKAATALEAGPPARDPKFVETMFANMKLRLQIQQNNLSLTDTLVSETQRRIDDLKAEGQDTSALETALAEYKSKVASAQQAYNEAQAIIDAHAGFGANGKVVDAAQAKETVKSAGEAIRDVHRALREAIRTLRHAARGGHRDLKPGAAPPAASPSLQLP